MFDFFFTGVRKKDGTDYEPDTITSIQSSLDRYLRCNGKDFSIKRYTVFSHSKKVLKAKRKNLKSEGKGNKKQKCDALSTTDISKMYGSGVLCTGKKLSLFILFLGL